ncbi:hypothetical protein ADIMK_1729 [Marinobacterium lacunae]|uniref:Uncharacterized protein n=1 Tax=Marinobacterium lacunae TaxID=1232683 RepID=A0A081FZN9_9GAMM|nr:hypothetical protein ADIMK_1729 [Marinobacterium lacunae]
MGRFIILVILVVIVVFSMNSCDHALDVKRSLWDNEQR